MDTDDLTDDAYAIIANARRVNGLLGAELAVSGTRAKSEREFLRSMLKTLAAAHEDLEEYLGDEEDNPMSAAEFAKAIQHLETTIRLLLLK